MKKLLFVLLISITSCAYASSEIKLSQLQELLLQFVINEYDTKKIFYVLNKDSDFYITKEDALSLNLKITNNNIYTIAKEEYINISKVKDLKLNYDTVNLVLYITATHKSFNIIKKQLNNTNQNKITPENAGAFLNYDANLRVDKVNSSTSGEMLGELGVFNKSGFGSLDFITKYIGSGSQRKSVITRLNTKWIVDDNISMRRTIIGDSISSAADWGGAVRFAGIQVQRNFASQPKFITYPTPDISGSAALPTNIDIFVNDTLVNRQAISQGPFEISGLSTISGAGNMSIVTRDILGRETKIFVPYYTSQSFLQPGLSDYSFEIGALRQNYSTNSFKYKDLFTSFTYRQGINHYWTAGTHFEGTKNVYAAGIDNTINFFNIGELNNSIALSKKNGLTLGKLFSLGYIYRSTKFSFGSKVTVAKRDFAFVGSVDGKLTPSLTSTNFVGYSTKTIGNISLSYTIRNNRSTIKDKFYLLNCSKNLNKHLNVSYGAIFDKINASNNKLFMNLIFTFGADKAISSNIDSYNRTVRYSKFSNKDNDYGYNISATRGNVTREQADINFKHNVGELQLKASRAQSKMNFQGNALGALVFIGNEIKLSKKLSSGFALVRVPGGNNIEILKNNYTVGKLNKNNSIIVPNLLDYNDNSISLGLTDSPLNLVLDKSQKNITPYYRSGYVIDFKTKKIRNISLTLVDDSNKPIAPGTKLTLNNSTETYYVGYNGEAYLQPDESNTSIRIKANIDTNLDCVADILLEGESSELVTELGTVICKI